MEEDWTWLGWLGESVSWQGSWVRWEQEGGDARRRRGRRPSLRLSYLPTHHHQQPPAGRRQTGQARTQDRLAGGRQGGQADGNSWRRKPPGRMRLTYSTIPINTKYDQAERKKALKHLDWWSYYSMRAKEGIWEHNSGKANFGRRQTLKEYLKSKTTEVLLKRISWNWSWQRSPEESEAKTLRISR